jgi:uncharacterized protein (TIGR00251 family)
MADSKTTVQVHVQPGARTSEIQGVRNGVVYVRVAAPPREGRANRALLELMARTMAVKKGDLEIIRGHTSRDKVVAVQGITSAEVMQRLEGTLPGMQPEGDSRG